LFGEFFLDITHPRPLSRGEFKRLAQLQSYIIVLNQTQMIVVKEQIPEAKPALPSEEGSLRRLVVSRKF